MNPYARFGLVSNSVSAALLVGALAVFGPTVFAAIGDTAGSGPALWGSLAAAVTVLVVFWLAMTEAIFPTLFRLNSVRKMVLGKYYIEGTWLQAEKGEGTARMAVIDIQPSGKSFIFSGYALNSELEIESNALIEFSKFEWPFMTYKSRNSLSDGADGQREGVGEIQFEMNRDAARRYNGYVQYVKNEARLKIEGTKLTKGREVRKLRSLEGREEVFGKYWDLFFNRTLKLSHGVAPAVSAPAPASSHAEERAPAAQMPMPAERESEHEERRARLAARTEELVETIIPRRRASDWSDEADDKADAPRRRASDAKIVNTETSEDGKAKKLANGSDRPLR